MKHLMNSVETSVHESVERERDRIDDPGLAGRHWPAEVARRNLAS